MALSLHLPFPRRSRLSHIRWGTGMVSAVLWAFASLGSEPGDTRLWLTVAAVLVVELFGAFSAALLITDRDDSLISVVTNWTAVVFSIMACVVGAAAAAWFGIGAAHIILLVVSLLACFAWLAFLHLHARSIHPDARGRA